MATILDVAARAGVSKTLVSRYINGKPGVSPASAAKIADAIRELHYWPNAIARSLVLRETGMIGVIVDDLCSPFHFPLIRGMEKAIDEHATHYDVIFLGAGGDPEKKKQQITKLTQGRVDGLIIYGSFVADDDLIRQLVSTGFPFVLIENDIPEKGVNKVVIDNRIGAYRAVKHLIEQGCRDILHLAGNLNLKVTYDRRWGYLQAMKEQGLFREDRLITPDFSSIHTSGYKSEFFESGYRAFRELIAKNDLPEAAFFATDVAAFGAMQALREAGLSVPEDLRIVGFDDENPAFCGCAFDPITTVRQPLFEAGHEAMHLLFRTMLHPEAEKQRILLPTELILRHSAEK